jgi:prepilin-type N-terminal cleavage/methylation domain-containing protein
LEGFINLKFKTKNLKLNHGYSLIEIIVVLALVAIMTSTIIAVLINVQVLNRKIEFRSLAYKALDSKVESLRATAFDSVTSGSFAVSGLPAATGNVTSTNIIEGSPQNDIKLVTVTINWNFKRAQSIQTSTYITRNGITR